MKGFNGKSFFTIESILTRLSVGLYFVAWTPYNTEIRSKSLCLIHLDI